MSSNIDTLALYPVQHLVISITAFTLTKRRTGLLVTCATTLHYIVSDHCPVPLVTSLAHFTGDDLNHRPQHTACCLASHTRPSMWLVEIPSELASCVPRVIHSKRCTAVGLMHGTGRTFLYIRSKKTLPMKLEEYAENMSRPILMNNPRSRVIGYRGAFPAFMIVVTHVPQGVRLATEIPRPGDHIFSFLCCRCRDYGCKASSSGWRGKVRQESPLVCKGKNLQILDNVVLYNVVEL